MVQGQVGLWITILLVSQDSERVGEGYKSLHCLIDGCGWYGL